jgi:SRSO17 transposase
MGASPLRADEPPRTLADLNPETREPWYPDFDRYFQTYVPLFDLDGTGRTAEQARRYAWGLLGNEEVKSMEPIAERTATPYHRTQHFITDSPWPPEIVQLAHAKDMGSRFASPNGVLALDDEGDPKKGDDSAGVYRQYCGNRGKEENCQVGVCLSYVRPDPERYADMESFGMGMQLYLPKERAEDPVHREKTHVPEKIQYEPKWKIGLGLIDRVLALKLPHRAVAADADYGRAGDFRKALRDRKEAYVLGVQPTQTEVGVLGKDGRPAEPRKLSEVAKGLPEKAWKKVVWSQGTKGKLTMEAARLRAQVCAEGKPIEKEEVWVVFERRDNETKAYVVWGLAELGLRAQVQLIRARWGIELWFEHGKSELGLDQFEGRTWPGWHHNATMVMLAHGFLTIERSRGKGKKGEPLPTLPAVKRGVQHRVSFELGTRLVEEEGRDRRERLLITFCYAMGRPPKLTKDGHIFVSSDWRDYLDAPRW